jgi:hypothetical protein
MAKKSVTKVVNESTPTEVVAVETVVTPVVPQEQSTKKVSKGKKAVEPTVTVVEPAVTVAEPVVTVAEQTKTKSKKTTKSTEPAVAPVVVSTTEPVAEPSKEDKPKGKKASKSVKTTEPSAVIVQVTEPVSVTEPAKKTKVKKTAKSAEPLPETLPEPLPATQVDQELAEVDDDDEKKRYFKYVYEGEVSGRFSGNKPKQAANKALTSIAKGMGVNAEGAEINFSIVECTRGSKRKVYKYKGRRVKLDKPMEVLIKGKEGNAGKTIVYNYNNKVQKLKVNDA